MSIATLKKKTQSVIKSNISSYGVFTLAGSVGTRRPIWCADGSIFNTEAVRNIPIRSVKSAGSNNPFDKWMTNQHGVARGCCQNICPSESLVAGNYDDYNKTLNCCLPLVDGRVHEGPESSESTAVDKLCCNPIVKKVFSAVAESDYINWKGRRQLILNESDKKRIGGTDCSLCVVYIAPRTTNKN